MVKQHQNIKHILKRNREAVFQKMYERNFPIVARMIKHTGGTLSDAQDVFQDALLIFYEKMTQPNFEIKSSANAYLVGIAKHLWYQQSKSTAMISFTEMEQTIAITPDYFKADRQIVKEKRLLRMLQGAGQKCVQLLQAFYYKKWSMAEISRTFGYSSTRSATVQKYKCLEKIRKEVKEKSIDYAEILN